MNEDQKQTREGITFRIPSSSINRLREESKKKLVSLNTLVNQILKDHLDWHTYSAQARFYPIPRSTMSRIVDKLTVEEISELAIDVAKNTVDLGRSWYGNDGSWNDDATWYDRRSWHDEQ